MKKIINAAINGTNWPEKMYLDEIVSRCTEEQVDEILDD